MSDTIISVMVPVFNREDYLPATLDSLLNQSYPHFEVLLANDGSSDASLAICQDYALRDSRFIVINHEINRGLSFIRADTLPRARGKYVALLDSDDLAHPQRFEKQVSFLENNLDVVLLGSYVSVIDGAGKTIGSGIMPTSDLEIRWRLTFGNCLSCPSLMFRKDAAMRCGGFDAALLAGEDMEFSSRILSQGKATVLNEKLALWRTHENNLQKTESAFKKQELVRSVRKSICRHLGLDVSEDLAATVYTHPAPSQEVFLSGLELLVHATEIFLEKQELSASEDRAALGHVAFISLFELAARNRKQDWWPLCETTWRKSTNQTASITGYQWNHDMKLLGQLHPRKFLGQMWFKQWFFAGRKQ